MQTATPTTQTINLRFDPQRTGPTVTFEYPPGQPEICVYGPHVGDAIFATLVRSMVEGPVSEVQP